MPEKTGDGGIANLIQALDTFNPFDKIGPPFRSLVEARKFDEAQKLFDANYDAYFRKRYIEEKRPLPSELKNLGNWHYESNFKHEVDEMLARLKEVTSPGEPATWAASIALLNKADYLNARLVQSALLAFCGKNFPRVQKQTRENKQDANRNPTRTKSGLRQSIY